MYKIKPFKEAVFIPVQLPPHAKPFKWSRNFEVQINYPWEDRKQVLISVTYTVNCELLDEGTPSQQFVLLLRIFHVIQESDTAIKVDSDEVYDCVKIAEADLEENLTKKNVSLSALNLKPITRQEWSDASPDIKFTFSDN